MTGVKAKAAVALVVGSAVTRLLMMGSGGTTVVGGETIRTGPVPVWLVDLLYSPEKWVVPAVLGTALVVVGLAYAGYRRSGVDAKVKREAAANGTIVCAMGASTMALMAVAPYWAAVPIGSAVGFAGGTRGASWLGL